MPLVVFTSKSNRTEHRRVTRNWARRSGAERAFTNEKGVHHGVHPIIEYETANPDEVRRLNEEWERATQGKHSSDLDIVEDEAL